MDHFAGLDVSVKETSVCIVDDTGRIVREVRVASEPEALLQVLKNPAYRFKRVGLEAGPLSQWLFSALAEAGLPVICVETRHMRAVLKAQINKTDLTWLFWTKRCERIAWKGTLVMPKKRFSAEQIVTLLRQIEVLMAQGKSPRSLPRCRDIAAELLSLAQGIRRA